MPFPTIVETFPVEADNHLNRWPPWSAIIMSPNGVKVRNANLKNFEVIQSPPSKYPLVELVMVETESEGDIFRILQPMNSETNMLF